MSVPFSEPELLGLLEQFSVQCKVQHQPDVTKKILAIFERDPSSSLLTLLPMTVHSTEQIRAAAAILCRILIERFQALSYFGDDENAEIYRFLLESLFSLEEARSKSGPSNYSDLILSFAIKKKPKDFIDKLLSFRYWGKNLSMFRLLYLLAYSIDAYSCLLKFHVNTLIAIAKRVLDTREIEHPGVVMALKMLQRMYLNISDDDDEILREIGETAGKIIANSIQYGNNAFPMPNFITEILATVSICGENLPDPEHLTELILDLVDRPDATISDKLNIVESITDLSKRQPSLFSANRNLLLKTLDTIFYIIRHSIDPDYFRTGITGQYRLYEHYLTDEIIIIDNITLMLSLLVFMHREESTAYLTEHVFGILDATDHLHQITLLIVARSLFESLNITEYNIDDPDFFLVNPVAYAGDEDSEDEPGSSSSKKRRSEEIEELFKFIFGLGSKLSGPVLNAYLDLLNYLVLNKYIETEDPSVQESLFEYIDGSIKRVSSTVSRLDATQQSSVFLLFALGSNMMDSAYAGIGQLGKFDSMIPSVFDLMGSKNLIDEGALMFLSSYTLKFGVTASTLEFLSRLISLVVGGDIRDEGIFLRAVEMTSIAIGTFYDESNLVYISDGLYKKCLEFAEYVLGVFAGLVYEMHRVRIRKVSGWVPEHFDSGLHPGLMWKFVSTSIPRIVIGIVGHDKQMATRMVDAVIEVVGFLIIDDNESWIRKIGEEVPQGFLRDCVQYMRLDGEIYRAASADVDLRAEVMEIALDLFLDKTDEGLEFSEDKTLGGFWFSLERETGYASSLLKRLLSVFTNDKYPDEIVEPALALSMKLFGIASRGNPETSLAHEMIDSVLFRIDEFCLVEECLSQVLNRIAAANFVLLHSSKKSLDALADRITSALLEVVENLDYVARGVTYEETVSDLKKVSRECVRHMENLISLGCNALKFSELFDRMLSKATENMENDDAPEALTELWVELVFRLFLVLGKYCSKRSEKGDKRELETIRQTQEVIWRGVIRPRIKDTYETIPQILSLRVLREGQELFEPPGGGE